MLTPILRFFGLKRPLEDDSESLSPEDRPSSKPRMDIDDAPASSQDAPAPSPPALQTPSPITPSDTPATGETPAAASASSADPATAPLAATEAGEPVVVLAPGGDSEDAEEEEDEEEEEEVRGVSVASLKSIKELYELDVLEATTTVFPHNQELNKKVVIWRGDITSLKVDAIVNAANRALLGGGGVDGAIHSAAGRGLYQECKLLNGAETGESKITGGHRLPARHVIHTVGPIYSRANKEQCERDLRSCYQSTLELAVANECKTLAFSGISTGIYGYPLDDATRVALGVTRAFLESPAGASLERVVFTVFRQIDVNSYNDIAPEFFPPPPTVIETKEEEAVKEAEVKEIETGTTELHLDSQEVKVDAQ